jgi:SAM-dependent methyltransferase
MSGPAASPCPRRSCPAHAGTPLLRSAASPTSRPLALRLCSACGAAITDPWPSAQEVAALYTEEYTCYRPAREDPEAEASSLKFRLAGTRYRRLTNPGAASWFPESVGRVVELLGRRTISYSLGIPLSLRRDSPMLDYGCGTGFWLRAMRRRGFGSLYGYDIAPNREVRERLAADGVELVSESGLEARAGFFELVRLEHVFEHLQDPIATLGRLRRALRPSGWLVMTFPSIEPWLGVEDLERSPARDHLQFPMHLVHHSRTSAAEWLAAGGFDVLGLRVTRNERFLTVVASPGRARERSA